MTLVFYIYLKMEGVKMTQELEFLAEDVTALDLEITRANFHKAKERENTYWRTKQQRI